MALGEGEGRRGTMQKLLRGCADKGTPARHDNQRTLMDGWLRVRSGKANRYAGQGKPPGPVLVATSPLYYTILSDMCCKE